MLTNFYYTNYYKPYLLTTKSSSVSSAKKDEAIKEPSTSGFSYVSDRTVLLNKSPVKNTVQYAAALSKGIVSLRGAAASLTRNAEDFFDISFEEGKDEAKAWLTEDLDAFAEAYNNLSDFSDKQHHSATLKDLMAKSKDFLAKITGSSELLISDETGKLSVNKESLEARLNFDERSVLEQVSQAGRSIMNSVKEFLQKPLSVHMDFKNPGYYYNYKIGSYSENTFGLIESGMLVDIRL